MEIYAEDLYAELMTAVKCMAQEKEGLPYYITARNENVSVRLYNFNNEDNSFICSLSYVTDNTSYDRIKYELDWVDKDDSLNFNAKAPHNDINKKIPETITIGFELTSKYVENAVKPSVSCNSSYFKSLDERLQGYYLRAIKEIGVKHSRVGKDIVISNTDNGELSSELVANLYSAIIKDIPESNISIHKGTEARFMKKLYLYEHNATYIYFKARVDPLDPSDNIFKEQFNEARHFFEEFDIDFSGDWTIKEIGCP